MRKYIGLVLPYAPKIDESFATFLVGPLLAQGRKVKYFFCDTVRPSQNLHNEISHWGIAKDDTFFVDVFPNKYHGKAPSASQMVLDRFSEIKFPAEIVRLVNLINQNNSDGSLKKQRHSIASILRRLYFGNNGCDNCKVVLQKTFEVFKAYFLPATRPFSEIYNPGNEELRDFWKKLKVKDVGDFTIARYFQQLFEAGVNAEAVLTKVGWWLDVYDGAAEQEKSAKEKFYNPEIFALRSGDLVGAYVEVNSEFESQAFVSDYLSRGDFMFAIIKHSSGRVLIASSKKSNLDLSEVFGVLRSKEGGCWHFESRYCSHMVMNGSVQYNGLPKTGLTKDALVRICADRIKFQQTEHDRYSNQSRVAAR